MTWFTGSLTYLMLWWLVLFTVLPWGATALRAPEPGFDRGAPENPRLLLKFAITTLIAAVLWGAVYAIIEHSGITLAER